MNAKCSYATINTPIFYPETSGTANTMMETERGEKVYIDETIICPGCGWVGSIEKLVRNACANCGYENNLEPYRLLTLSEMLSDGQEYEVYDEVSMCLFLKSLFNFIGYSWEKL